MVKRTKITRAMLQEGERALLDALGDEYDGGLSSRTPGLQIACGQIFRAMLKASDQLDYQMRARDASVRRSDRKVG
jgi:hypothetical protein